MPRTATGSPSVCRVMASRKLYTAEQAAAVVVSGSSDESSDEASSSDEFSQNEGPMSSSRTPLSEIQTNFIGSRTRSGSSAKNIPKDIIWSTRENMPHIHPFVGTPGLKCDLQASSEPFEIFLRFFTPSLIEDITRETNIYANSCVSYESNSRRHDITWKDCTVDEMQVFFALCISMGLVTKTSFDKYWTRDEVLETPFFPKTMPRDRFRQIRSALHFTSNENADSSDRLFKIRSVIDSCTQTFASVFVPYRDICVDESMMKFHGRISFKQFNPSKRARFGIKVYKLCQSTGHSAGYISNFKIYTGQDRDGSEDPASTAVVMHLMDSLLDKGYNVYLDNWYSSPDLFVKLMKRNTNACGTVRLNRKNMPADILNESRKKGDVSHRSSTTNPGLLVLIWKDKKDVKMLSTMHSSEMKETGKQDRSGNKISKPVCVIDYNHGMGGVDRSDQLAATCRSTRKSIKWYKKLFFYLLDMCITNAFVVYKELHAGTNLQCSDFKLQLVKGMMTQSNLPIYSVRGRPHSGPTPSRLHGRHFPMKIPSNPSAKKRQVQKRCTVCYENGIRKETIYQCDSCEIPLCVAPCFKMFHTQLRF